MTLTPIQVKVYIDWSGNGSFADANEDCSADFRGATITRGRGAVTDDFGAGTMQLTLLNTVGLYSAFNSGGALYGSIFPDRAVKLDTIDAGGTRTQFRGSITEIQEMRENNSEGRPYVKLVCSDGFDKLSRNSIGGPVVANNPLTTWLSTIRALAHWLSLLTDFTGGLYPITQTLPLFWVPNLMTPLEAFRLCARQDPGSQLFCSRDGKVTYKNRYDRSAQPVYATLSEPEAFAFGLRQADFIDTMNVTWAGLSLATAVTDLCTLPASVPYEALPQGSTDARNMITGGFQTGGYAPIQPVPYTDYTFNTINDGTGVDVTPFVSVSSWSNTGNSFTATLTNTYPATVYRTLFKVRGRAVNRSAATRLLSVNNPYSPVANQSRQEDFAYNDDLNMLTGYANTRLYALSVVQPRPQVIRPVDSDAEAAIVLGAELGLRVHVTKTTSIYAPQIDADFFIEGISVTIPTNGIIVATWTLAHEDVGGGSMFRISGTSGAGQDYSLIGSNDRVGY
jgi:hypothetical protein